MAIYVNDRLVEFGRYPNGEAVVPRDVFRRRDGDPWPPTVRLHWEDDSDLVRLALTRGMVLAAGDYPRLIIDYMPYSRMDRTQDGHCFSLRYAAALIRSLRWSLIGVVEPHSAATLAELGEGAYAYAINATAKLLPKVMERVNFDVTTDFLVLPDKGALDRYAEQARDIFDVCHLVIMRKARDFATGKIKGLEVDHVVTRGVRAGAAMVARKALIVDDLSSRGGTFVQAAEILRELLDFAQVYLLVTHMEQVGLEGDLTTKLDQVFCTSTLLPTGYTLPNNFTVFPRSDWL